MEPESFLLGYSKQYVDAGNILAQPFGKHYAFLLGTYLTVQLLSDMFDFGKSCQTVFQSNCTKLHSLQHHLWLTTLLVHPF